MLQTLNFLAPRKVHAHVITTINILSEWDDAKVGIVTCNYFLAK